MQPTDSELHVVVGIGPVGRPVIDELVSRGLRVRAVARHDAPDLVSPVEFMAADVTDGADPRCTSVRQRRYRVVRALC
jgi:nucleoside-diphosphate-sugar epimerase